MNWEYWPFHVFYLPIYPFWLWYSFKARSLFFYVASNPTIKNGGFILESKKEIAEIIPDQYTPTTLFFFPFTSFTKIKNDLVKNNLSYPLIIKPDIGMQGKAVMKIGSDNELKIAASKFNVNFIIQPFVPYPNELGIFYVRYPNEESGKITGIVEKKFLSVVGNGIDTIETLLKKNPRYLLQLPTLKKALGNELFNVLRVNEEKILVPYGNHARGSLFIDATNKKTEMLEKLIDKVAKSIDGYYYGRLDIRFTNFEELENNKNWSIIELNGAGSDPTHMYDPKHSILFAWKEVVRHWKMLYTVSKQNNKKGFPYLSFKNGYDSIKENSFYVKQLNLIGISLTNNNAKIEKHPFPELKAS